MVRADSPGVGEPVDLWSRWRVERRRVVRLGLRWGWREGERKVKECRSRRWEVRRRCGGGGGMAVCASEGRVRLCGSVSFRSSRGNNIRAMELPIHLPNTS